MTSIFLSYARSDDEPFVKQLRDDLTVAGFEVWFDRHDLRSRGLTFHHEIREAIAARDRMLLVVGPNAVASEYVRQEWQFAWFDAEKVVTPILRQGDYPLMPDELKLLHCEDFRDDAQYQVHLQNLIASLKAPVPPLGKLIGVPSLPAHFLTRTDRLIPLRDAVRSGLDTPAPLGGTATHQKFHGIASTSRQVGMHGMGGIGKSVLANLLVHDRKVREAFPDGIVWVGLGSLPNITELQRRVHRDLGGDGAIATEHEGKTKLMEWLADKSVLLVLDDVWRRSDADAFNVLGPRCRGLITTRDAGLLTSLGGKHHPVELLTEAEAFDLISQTSSVSRDALPRDAHGIVAECGRLPLAVSLCGALVRRNISWSSVLEQLQQARIDRIADRHAVEPQHQSVWHAIHVSVEALESGEKARFLELGVFPPDETTPEPAAATLWQQTGSLDAWATEELLTTLAERSLVQMTAPVAGSQGRRFSLHDLIYDYTQRAQSDQRKLHDQLLTAYEKKCSHGWPTGPNDGYFFEHLRHHLVSAGHPTEAFQLLTDLDWLGAKTRAGLVFDLVRDVQEAEQDLTEADRVAFLPWSHFLRGNASFLGEHPASFFQQAYNEPIQSPASQAAQHLWSLACGTRERSASALPALVPSALLEWLNRPAEWHPPACRATLQGHTHIVTSVALSGDGSTVVSGSADETLKVWDARTGACRATLQGHTHWVESVALSVDGSTVVTGSWDNSAKVWDARTGACRATLQGHTDDVASVGLSGDSSTVVSGSHDKTVKVWDARTGACRATFQGHTHVVTSVALSGDGSTVVSGSGDNTVKVWDARTGACRATLQGHTESVDSVALSVDASTVVSGSFDKSVKVWDTRTGACRATLQGHTSWVASVALSVDASTVVSGSFDKSVKVWDTRTGACRATLQGHTSWVASVALSVDGSTVVSGSQDKTVKVWDARTEACRATLQGHTSTVTSVAVSGDGSTVVSGSCDNTVKVWDARTGACRAALQGHTLTVGSVAVSGDGSTVVSGSYDNTVKVWDARTGACRATLQTHTLTVGSVAVSGDGSTVVSGFDDQTMKVWDARTGACRATLQGHTARVHSLELSGDESTVVSGSRDKTVKVWDARTGACRATLQGHTSWVASVALSGDGSTVVSGSTDQTVKVWDARTGRCRSTLQGHTSSVHRLALSVDRSTVVSGSHDKTVKVWDARTGACRATYPFDSREAHAAWQTAGAWNVSARCAIVDGCLRIPAPDGATALIMFGPFDIAVGPLVDDKILAFNGNGEAFWFQIRRHAAS